MHSQPAPIFRTASPIGLSIEMQRALQLLVESAWWIGLRRQAPRTPGNELEIGAYGALSGSGSSSRSDPSVWLTLREGGERTRLRRTCRPDRPGDSRIS